MANEMGMEESGDLRQMKELGFELRGNQPQRLSLRLFLQTWRENVPIMKNAYICRPFQAASLSRTGTKPPDHTPTTTLKIVVKRGAVVRRSVGSGRQEEQGGGKRK